MLSFSQGKVRDIYDLGDRLLLVASDRISAYDCVLPDLIPDKGRVLTQLSLFWFAHPRDLVENHFVSADPRDFPDVGLPADYLEGRAMLVNKAEPLPVECIVRGYLAGSGWAEYRKSGTIAGQPVVSGLTESVQLPEPLFTPSTKAKDGHDENITIGRLEELVGGEVAGRLASVSTGLYRQAAKLAWERGIIIADTKFEFGWRDGRLILIDEVLTPDSSRFWPLADYHPGRPQPSFDKQFVRDYLDKIGWDHQPPAPHLPAEVIEQTRTKYVEAYERLTGKPFAWRAGSPERRTI